MNTQFPITSNQALGFLPAAVAGATYMTSRGAAVFVGLTAKKASSAANAIGQEKIGQYLNTAGEKCISFATRSPKTELAVVGALALLGASAVGVSELLPQDNLSVLEYGKRMIGMTKTLSPWEYLGEHPSIFGWASSAFMGLSLFASGGTTTKTEVSIWSCADDEKSQQDLNEITTLPTGLFVGFPVDGKPDGKGKLITKDNTTYYGEFENGSFKSGKITFNDGREFALNEDLRENRGTYTGFLNDNNRPHGPGTLTYNYNASIHEGIFENGKLAQGTRIFPNGNIVALNKTVGHSGKTGTYSGPLNEKNQPHGEGILITSEGTTLKGEFKNGTFQGKA